MSVGDSLLKHGFNAEAEQEFHRSLWLADSVDTSTGQPLYTAILPLGKLQCWIGQCRIVRSDAPPRAKRPVWPHELEYKSTLNAAFNQRFHDGL